MGVKEASSIPPYTVTKRVKASKVSILSVQKMLKKYQKQNTSHCKDATVLGLGVQALKGRKQASKNLNIKSLFSRLTHAHQCPKSTKKLKIQSLARKTMQNKTTNQHSIGKKKNISTRKLDFLLTSGTSRPAIRSGKSIKASKSAKASHARPRSLLSAT
jgi:hypothetical protein